MSAAQLLDRLNGVKATAPGRWLARCPAHEDRSPSLSVRELEDGRILLHDFGGCPTGDVLAALGLALQDLFPRELATHRAPTHSRIPARDLLQIIDQEVAVVSILAADMLERRTMSEADWLRLARAASRIGRACNHVR